ncbi:PDF receptor isoform X1 [Drosophila biarmipes]|uniref:PDF receptor isoform X1 n=1 Tax=Drosophila biarmipes TaxID=125945 RepID=UPI0007E73033|nr:PDF receptor isoform X1 [Drosophila biarmipes]XP_016948716.1 PDF receptor isoform X1 [Drosophila biarmipes]XP_016948717.1 PDF receptor isoform X1 [Drosophila biarmipes]XP_043949293.1 PDF receptor isoform X1 [Drosophila biarmipes]
MTLLSNILDCGGGISAQRFTRLLRQSSSPGFLSSSSLGTTFESKSMLEPTSSHVLPTGRVPVLHDFDFDSSTTELPRILVLDGVAGVATMALEPTAMDAVLPDSDPDQVLSNFNISAPWNITLASAAATNFENCSSLFVNYTLPQTGLYCNWTWDTLLCWPPTPAGVLARMNCPGGFHGVDTRKFAIRKCELDGRWGSRPNATEVSPPGWTDYGPCYKPEIIRLMQQMGSKDFDLYIDIARKTRTLEIVGLCLSLFALIVSLLIFCTFRSLRNNRTKIHKNLFVAMVLQVIIRLTLYLDQFRRGNKEAATNTSLSVIENTPYLCEASYVLLEYARTAMFMWMFIEGLYLHNMVTVAVFQGSFPLKFFSRLGWGFPILMTTVWARCTVMYMDTSLGECLWNYNLTPYYWILEGPRLAVILLNFCFLVNIIRVLVMKLRQSQASDIEQTRKAVRAAIVLLPLLGITNLLHQLAPLKTATNFAVWSYGTHFLTSFQGFFIALIYCFLNGEVRAVLLKSLATQLSVRGHPEWAPKRASMYSGAYNTAPDTDAVQPAGDPLATGKRISPPHKRLNGRKPSSASIVMIHEPQQRHRLIPRLQNKAREKSRDRVDKADAAETDPNQDPAISRIHSKETGIAGGTGSRTRGSKWIMGICFRGQKDKCVMPGSQKTQQIFMTSQLPPTSTLAAVATTITTTTTTAVAAKTTIATIATIATITKSKARAKAIASSHQIPKA